MTTTTPSRVPLTKLFFGTSMQPQQHLCATAETIEPVVVVPPPPPPTRHAKSDGQKCTK